MRRPLAGSLVACSLAFFPPAAGGTPGTPPGLSAGDWSGIRAAHEAWKRAPLATPEGSQTRRAGQRWRTSFDGRGFTLEPDDGAWAWGLELERWGFGGALREIETVAADCADGERVEYGWDAALTEWYVHRADGLEHGYTVHRRPAGAGPLRFELAVRGGLVAAIDADGRGARFVDERDQAALVYAGLAVFDAAGRALDARMAALPGGLRIEVDERGARYPLCIDPLVQEAYLKPWNTGSGDHFGTSVAVSGSTVVVGAPDEDSSSTTIGMGQADNGAVEAGAAYVFVRSGSGWIQQAYLKASNTGAGDGFGASVAVSGDTVVVGAESEDSSSSTIGMGQSDDSASGAGAAYVFVRSGTVWSQQAYLKASNCGAEDYFGFSVAVSGDTVVVGALFEDSSSTTIGLGQFDEGASNAGAAYVFVRSGTTWSQQSYLKASNTDAQDWFGFSVAVSGDAAVVGALQEASSSTAIDQGQGDNSAPRAGAAYVFARSGTTWSRQAYLKASNAAAADDFGSSVSISESTVLVGALGEDSSSTTIDMGQGDNGANFAGAAYVFVRVGTAWSQQAYLKASNTGAFDGFGSAVSLSGDLAVVGAYEEDSHSDTIDAGQGDNSAPGAGAAYVFARAGSTWSLRAYLKASNSEAGDNYASSVGVSSNLVVCGAPGESSSSTSVDVGPLDNRAPYSGAAFVLRMVPPLVLACFGDGSGAPCPCGNVSASGAGQGCSHSFGTGGRLAAAGIATLAIDTLVLSGSHMPNAGALYFQGTSLLNGGLGAPFGDGLRCAGGSILRLSQVVNASGASQYPQAGDLPVSVRGLVTAPSLRVYQVWYRNAAAFCTSDGWNLTNAVAIEWLP